MSNNRRIVLFIVVGVFLWGTTLAIGAYVNYTLTDNPWRVWRAVVVLLFVEAFLAFWLVLLFSRRGTQSDADQDPTWESSRHAPRDEAASRGA